MTQGRQLSAANAAEPDPGLFGPASVSWRIHGDPAMALGGLRALMLQALHPLAMAGVVQHSQYRHDPWGRLARTGEYMAAITYGTTPEALDAAARIRAVHSRIAGVEPESGLAYRADDPDLLLWVHCAGADSFLSAYRRCGGRLSRADADAYLAEQVRAAALVGVPEASCPADCRALGEYFERMRPALRETQAARDGLRFLFSPPMPLPARPAWLGVASIAFAMLPRWARLLYGLPGLLYSHPGADLAALIGGRGLRAMAALLPGGMGESPARRAALERLAA